MAAKIPIERVEEIMKVVLTELKNTGGEAKLADSLPPWLTEENSENPAFAGTNHPKSRRVR